MQVVDPAAEYVPAAQSVGVAVPAFAHLVPAGHWVHDEEPAVLVYPAAQSCREKETRQIKQDIKILILVYINRIKSYRK